MWRTTLFILVLSSAGTAAERTGGKSVTRNGVEVSYGQITDRYASAIADICARALEVCRERFACDLPSRLRVRVEVNWQDGPTLASNGRDEIVLRLANGQQLSRASSGGVNYVYGLCRTIAQLAFDRAVDGRGGATATARNGWGHYAGSVLLDEVVARRGRRVWPDRSDDYLIGLPALVNQLHWRNAPDEVRAAGDWQRLVTLIGNRRVSTVLRTWPDVLAGSAGSVGVDVASFELPGLKQWRANARARLIGAGPGEAEGALVAEDTLSGHPVVLVYDDGRAEGKRRQNGARHGVRFEAPAGDWYLQTVWIHAKRLGHSSVSHDDIEVFLYDGQMRRIGEFFQRDTQFRRGPTRWHRVSTPPVRVPRRFAVSVRFSDDDPRGFDVSHDDTHPGHAFTIGTDGKSVPLTIGNWMIRVSLDRRRRHDPLRFPHELAAMATPERLDGKPAATP